MSRMFCNCSSLKELNLNNFNSNNVTNMSNMFCGCSSLEKLNLNSFNTKKVTNMCSMFKGCASLNELNLDNFNINNGNDMKDRFKKKKLHLDKLDIHNVNTRGMFSGCTYELKMKIINKFKNLNYKAFED